MEASALREHRAGQIGLIRDPRVKLFRLQSDERLVALIRRGNDNAFEALVARYTSRLLAFCQHMLRSREDAEDVLQEVFAAAYTAMRADARELNVKPWLYRIARNRCLNHLRRPQPTGVDSMDVYEIANGASTADKVEDKLRLRELVGDVKELPETQRTALLLREMGSLSYDQIALAMETTVPSVKSLLVRARVSLAEASEARRLTCDEVRMELGAVAEGLQKISPPVRRHVGTCDRCRQFNSELKQTNRRLAALAPVGAFALLKGTLVAKLFGGAATGSSSTAAGAGFASGTGIAAGIGGASAAAGGAVSAGVGAIVTKAAIGVATAAIITAGATQASRVTSPEPVSPVKSTVAAIAPPVNDPSNDKAAAAGTDEAEAPDDAAKVEDTPVAQPTEPVAVEPIAADPVADDPVADDPPGDSDPVIVDEDETTVVLPPDQPRAIEQPSETPTPSTPTPEPSPQPSPPPAAESPPPPTGPSGAGEPTSDVTGSTSSSGPTEPAG